MVFELSHPRPPVEDLAPRQKWRGVRFLTLISTGLTQIEQILDI